MIKLHNIDAKEVCLESLRELSVNAVNSMEKHNEAILDLVQESEIPVELFVLISDNLRDAKDNLINIQNLSKSMNSERESWMECTEYIMLYLSLTADVFCNMYSYKESGRITEAAFKEYYEIFQELNRNTGALSVNINHARSLFANSENWGI